MALTLEELESLTIDQLKESLVQYSIALDSANTNISVLAESKEVVVKKEKELELNIVSLENTISKNKVQIEDYENKIIALEAKVLEFEQLNKDLGEKSDNTVEELQKEINKLKEELLVAKNITRDISASKIPEKNNNLVIQTYLIKGWDNISGREEHGGRIFTKVTVVVKLELDRKKLSWNITSELLNINWSKEIDLTDPELTNLISQSSTNSWYRLLKGFLEIPDTIENNFDLNNRYVRD